MHENFTTDDDLECKRFVARNSTKQFLALAAFLRSHLFLLKLSEFSLLVFCLIVVFLVEIIAEI